MKKIIYFLLCVLLMGCQPQTTLTLIERWKNETNTAKFDIESYNQEKKKHQDWWGNDNRWKTSDSSIRVIEREEYIQKEERAKNSAFETKKTYSSDSLYLMIQTIYFYGNPLHSIEYDSKGNIIKEIDCEKKNGCYFPVEMLIKKVKKKYGIDLSYDDHLRIVSIKSYEDKNVYWIDIFSEIWGRRDKRIIIDAKTGKILLYQEGFAPLPEKNNHTE